MLVAPGVAREARLLCPVIPAKRDRELHEQAIVAGGDHDRTVARLEAFKHDQLAAAGRVA